MALAPQLEKEKIYEVLEANNVDQSVMSILSIRGYYLDSIGKKSVNDRNVYDDAIFIVSPEKIYRFRGNTDPSRYRKGIATLKTGIHRYGTGTHRGNPAFRQAEKVSVYRDETGFDFGYFGVNVHSGSFHTTSSLGCQTIPPQNWAFFRDTAYRLLKKYNSKGTNDWGQPSWLFDYLLIHESNRRENELIVSERYLPEEEEDQHG